MERELEGGRVKQNFINPNDKEIQERISKIINLEQQCPEYVTVQTEEEIGELLKNDNYFYAENNGEIVASIYKMPLLDNVPEEDQIYRLGGLSVKDFKNTTLEDKKKLLELLKKLEAYFEENNCRIILKTENPVLAKFLVKIGGEELSYDECKEKYPSFLDAYINKSRKSDDYYKTQKFYIRDKK